MHPAPIQPAEVVFSDGLAPFAPAFGESYHPQGNAFSQARQVFLQGNGLPRRWQGRTQFVILETGFGLGNNFLATWEAWRQDPAHSDRLVFISVERYPLTTDDLRRAHAASDLQPLADELVAQWPSLTPNLHQLSFEAGRVRLMLALGDIADWLRELVCSVDAFYLDGFAPEKNAPMWQLRLFKAMARLAAPGATVATWTAAPAVRHGLTSAGFDVSPAPQNDGNCQVTRATYAPAFAPRRAPGRQIAHANDERHALIVGGGLAGCAAAWSLAEHGWRTLVVDRLAGPAQATSGNAAALFHGTVNAQDGTHARFNRAAAFEAAKAVRAAIVHHAALGQRNGLLRIDTSGADVDAMRTALHRLGLPSDYVRALNAADASAVSGLSLDHPAWLYPQGGWVQPAALARSFLERSGALAHFRGAVHIDRLDRTPQGRWQARDADGNLIADTAVVVLANADDAMRLAPSGACWPTQRVRGQVSLLPGVSLNQRGLRLPTVPVAGSGYLLPEVNGSAIFGATAQPGDDDPSVRLNDHVHNLAQLSRLTGWSFETVPPDITGRTAWRWVADDRLPLIGAVPDPAPHPASRAPDQPRFVPRVPGLFVFGALGSRGVTWAALGGQVLASWISGSPFPLEAGLLDAVDPARFVSRAVRRAAR
jgi:tRNA 5-methylaminomethyl-2-thiouridine biosynthesis bifunctional protein